MDWDDLRFVLAVRRAGRMSGAADALGVTRTTVARRLKAFEAQLGVRLFDRTPDGLVATAAGEELATAAERMESEAHGVVPRIMGRDAELGGRLRVSTLDFVFRAFQDVFATFLTRYPRVELTMCAANAEVSLTRREADVVVRLNNAPSPYLVGRRVGAVQFAVYASEALAAAVGPGADLGAYPWIGWDERDDSRWLGDWLADNAPGYRFAVRLDAPEMVLTEAIAAGIGVHFLPCMTGDRLPGLVRVSPVEEQFARDLWVLTLPELRSASRVRAFMDHVVDGMTARPERFDGADPS